jgi:hypothetical protein
MRAYFFNNYYVGGIRAGIQAAHAIDQMWLQFVDPLRQGTLSGLEQKRFEMLCEFSRNHKTFILLHAGDHVVLNELANFFATDENPYPWVKFSEPGLNDAITSVAIVIPERLYDEASTVAGRAPIGTESSAVAVGDYSAWEIEFLKRRVVCALAQ